VVRLDLARALDVLAVQRVLDLALDQDRDGLVHLVADHPAGDRACVTLFHHALPALAFWFNTVFTRAMLRRTFDIWSGRDSCPAPRCMRRLNCSRNRPSSSSRSSCSLFFMS